MSGIFDNCPVPEPSSLVGFSTNLIASDVEGRSDQCLSAAIDNADSIYLPMCDDKVLVNTSVEEEPTAFFSFMEIEPLAPDLAHAVMLGTLDKRPIVALPMQEKIENIPTDFSVMDARSVLYASALPARQAGAIGMAISLQHWHKTNQYCGRCGAQCQPRSGGMRRDCYSCDAQYFPRTDPVVIMLALHGEKCLLGRNPNFPAGWYSCLAGFVEPGESIEQAVRRETAEESGIRIERVKYFASQPWPFPHSLMIGAYCEAVSEEIQFDGNELEDCRWFDRDEVAAMIDKQHKQELRTPPKKSIAAQIITNWAHRPN